MAPVATILSYRLGGTDGVSVEAAKWATALRDIGFETRRVAGAILDAEPHDVQLTGLAIEPSPSQAAPDSSRLLREIDTSDLVVVENLCSLPLNLAAARAAAAALREHAARGGRILFRHHDLPWQRRHLDHLAEEFPPRIDGALHVTVNLRSMRELASRNIPSHALHNRFDFDAVPGNRDRTRTKRGFGDAFVLFQPTRAIARKNVPGAVRYLIELSRLAPRLDLHYWLCGPAEDGYEPVLERVLERCPVPVTIGPEQSSTDAYAACDLVVFPSTWEGFGNPTIESVIARRPLAVSGYPVLAEIAAFGIQFFSTDYPEDVVRFMARPDPRRFELNFERARKAFSIEGLPADIDRLLAAHGWTSW